MKLLNKQYIQILLAMFLGFIFSLSFEFSTIFIPLGDIFIRLLKMMIVPIVFISITVGIGSISNSAKEKLEKVGGSVLIKK